MPTRARTTRATAETFGAATVVETGGDTVRVAAGRLGLAVEARIAHLPHWRPSRGDRVVVAEVDGETWIVAVLSAASGDAPGTVVEAASGDLILRAPSGRVRVEAGLDLEVDAGRDVSVRARRDHAVEAGRSLRVGAGRADPQLRIDATETELAGERLVLRAKAAELAAGTLSFLARTVATRALAISQEASRWDLSAGEIVEKARESIREVEGLAHERLGSVTTLVRETFSLRSHRTDLVSEEDTAIDGRKVLLG